MNNQPIHSQEAYAVLLPRDGIAFNIFGQAKICATQEQIEYWRLKDGPGRIVRVRIEVIDEPTVESLPLPFPRLA